MKTVTDHAPAAKQRAKKFDINEELEVCPCTFEAAAPHEKLQHPLCQHAAVFGWLSIHIPKLKLQRELHMHAVRGCICVDVQRLKAAQQTAADGYENKPVPRPQDW